MLSSSCSICLTNAFEASYAAEEAANCVWDLYPFSTNVLEACHSNSFCFINALASSSLAFRASIDCLHIISPFFTLSPFSK